MPLVLIKVLSHRELPITVQADQVLAASMLSTCLWTQHFEWDISGNAVPSPCPLCFYSVSSTRPSTRFWRAHWKNRSPA